MKLSQNQQRRRGELAFTMVEIALSLAVAAFAMVAIVGILPTGLQVQKDNREETLVNADGAYLLEAIRTGHDRLGRLSNSVYFVSVNFKDGDRETLENEDGGVDGQRLLGLLSSPRSVTGTGVSNTVAWMRAINSTAIDQDPEARDVAFRYQVITEITPYLGYPPSLTNGMHTNFLAQLNHLQDDLHEVRVTLRWPLYHGFTDDPDSVKVGSKRRTFRTLVAGSLQYYPTNIGGEERMVHYFQPSTY